jgi:hypothetical protein
MDLKHINLSVVMAMAFAAIIIGELQSLPSRIVAEQVQVQEKQAAALQNGINTLFSGKAPKDSP